MSLFPINRSAEELEALAEKLLDEVPSPPSATPEARVRVGAIEFQPLAYREPSSTDKKVMTYDASLAHVKAAGFPRHLRPEEIFALFIRHLEKKATAEEDAIAKDMLASHGEWTSLAIQHDGTTLHLYIDPENLLWNGSAYDATRMIQAKKESYPTTLTPGNYHNITTIQNTTPSLVERLWSKPFDNLPETIRTNGGLYIPTQGVTRPVGRGFFGSYDLDAYCGNGAVRGARAKSSTGNRGRP